MSKKPLADDRRREGLDDDAHQRPGEDARHGRDGEVVDLRRREDGCDGKGGDHLALPVTAPTAGAGSVTPTWVSVWVTAGSMTSRATLG